MFSLLLTVILASEINHYVGSLQRPVKDLFLGALVRELENLFPMFETQKQIRNLTLSTKSGDERLSGRSADELATVI